MRLLAIVLALSLFSTPAWAKHRHRPSDHHSSAHTKVTHKKKHSAPHRGSPPVEITHWEPSQDLVFKTNDKGLLVVSVNENDRYYRNTGTITLFDPFIENKVLGVYKFVTGGAGSGALPFGRYEVGAYRDDPGTSFTRDSRRFRRRWMIRQVGMNDGEARDKRGLWEWLELHSVHASGRTAGCLGVLGGDDVWDDFVSKMTYLTSLVGTVSFEIAPNLDGNEGETYVVAQHSRHFSIAHRHRSHNRGDKVASNHHHRHVKHRKA